MSTKEVDWVLDDADAWCRDHDQEPLTSAEAFVALVIGESVGRESRKSYLSVRTIMQATRLGERTVRRALSSLVERGVITRHINAWRGEDGRIPAHLAPNLYHWAIGRRTVETPAEPPAVPATPATQAPGGLPERHQPPATQAPRTVFGTNTPQPPASGGPKSDHCDKHARHRKACTDCRRALAASKAKPPWCGDCDERTRLIETESSVRRCSRCHPLRTAS